MIRDLRLVFNLQRLISDSWYCLLLTEQGSVTPKTNLYFTCSTGCTEDCSSPQCWGLKTFHFQLV